MVFDRFLRTLTQRTAKPLPAPTRQTSDVIPQAMRARHLTLPHPEEPMNPSATLMNTNLMATISKWLEDWQVPVHYWEYWKTAIDVQVYEVYPPSLTASGLSQNTPACAWDADGKRHLAVKPHWLNPGVIAHEQAHNSYAILTPAQKTAFANAYAPLKNSAPLIKALYSINKYGLTNDVEGHADVYRYLGNQMPAELKMYYPLLF